MEDYAQSITYTDEEKVLIFCKNIVKAVEKTREVVTKCEWMCHKANEALASKDKLTMWTVLQEYISRYKNLFTGANGVQLIYVDADFYEKLTEDDIAKQLRIVIGVIYLSEAKKCAAHEAIKQCLKKLLKKTEVFSNREIELLFG